MPAPHEVELKLRTHAVEHLELVAIGGDAVLRDELERTLDQALVVSSDCHVLTAREHSVEQVRVRIVDVRLPR